MPRKIVLSSEDESSEIEIIQRSSRNVKTTQSRLTTSTPNARQNTTSQQNTTTFRSRNTKTKNENYTDESESDSNHGSNSEDYSPPPPKSRSNTRNTRNTRTTSQPQPQPQPQQDQTSKETTTKPSTRQPRISPHQTPRNNQKSPSNITASTEISPSYDDQTLARILYNKVQASGPPSDNVIRVLLSSDNHLGFAENDSVRGEDSFRAFEECLRVGRDSFCDLYLFGGDMFHENKPSRNTLLRTTQLLRHYCTGKTKPQISIISDETSHFSDGSSNFSTSNHGNGEGNNDDNDDDDDDEEGDGGLLLSKKIPTNISIPAFTIHGNHDDPTGHPAISALDILHEAKLINYFGKHQNLDKIVVKPIVIQKNDTFLALYGIGNQRDERMAAIFKKGNVFFERFSPGKYYYENSIAIHEYNEYITNRNEYYNKSCQLYDQFQQRIQQAQRDGKKVPQNDLFVDLKSTEPQPYKPTMQDLDRIFGPVPHYNRNFLKFKPGDMPLEDEIHKIEKYQKKYPKIDDKNNKNNKNNKSYANMDQAEEEDYYFQNSKIESRVFHLPIIHQNRCRSCLTNTSFSGGKNGNTKPIPDKYTEHGKTLNSINPCLFPAFSDLILWGHEHCSCPKVLKINPRETQRDILAEYKHQRKLDKREARVKSEMGIAMGLHRNENVKGKGRGGKNDVGNAKRKRGNRYQSDDDMADSDDDDNGDNCRDRNDNADSDGDISPTEQLLKQRLFQHQNEINVLQPGSTVITSLCDGESFPKHCFILEIRGSDYRVTAIRLHTVRQFVLQDLHLTTAQEEELLKNQEDNTLLPLQSTQKVDQIKQKDAIMTAGKRGGRKKASDGSIEKSGAYIAEMDRYTQVLINKVIEMLQSLPPTIPRNKLPPLVISDRFIDENPMLQLETVLSLPLIRIRITKSDFKDKYTISQQFNNIVANPNDITLIVKPKLTRAQRLLLQRTQIKRQKNNPSQLKNLISSVQVGIHNSGEGNLAGENSQRLQNFSSLEQTMNEIPDLLLLNLINGGNLSLINHEVILDQLQQYVNNRDMVSYNQSSDTAPKTTKASKKSGLENLFSVAFAEVQDNLDECIQGELNEQVFRAYYDDRVNCGVVTPEQRDQKIADFLATQREIYDIDDDRVRKRRQDALTTLIEELKQELLIFQTNNKHDEEKFQTFFSDIQKSVKQQNTRYNKTVLADRMRLTRDDSDSDDEDNENNENNENNIAVAVAENSSSVVGNNAKGSVQGVTAQKPEIKQEPGYNDNTAMIDDNMNKPRDGMTNGNDGALKQRLLKQKQREDEHKALVEQVQKEKEREIAKQNEMLQRQLESYDNNDDDDNDNDGRNRYGKGNQAQSHTQRQDPTTSLHTTKKSPQIKEEINHFSDGDGDVHGDHNRKHDKPIGSLSSRVALLNKNKDGQQHGYRLGTEPPKKSEQLPPQRQRQLQLQRQTPPQQPQQNTTTTNNPSSLRQRLVQQRSTNIYDLTGCGDDPNGVPSGYSQEEKDEMVNVVRQTTLATVVPHSIPNNQQQQVRGNSTAKSGGTLAERARMMRK